MPQLHRCGTCENEFPSEEIYLEHECTTGFKPATVEHLDATSNGRFSYASAAAVKRGDARTLKEAEEAQPVGVGGKAPVKKTMKKRT